MLAVSLNVPPVPLDEQMRRGWNKAIIDEGWSETLAAADSMRGVAASKGNWPRDTQWRGWCAMGHESASWWPLVMVDYKREYLTSSFTAHLLKAQSENDIGVRDVAGYELRI